jgi:ribonuclease HI
MDTLFELETLASNSKRVTLAWVKAHVGLVGNEKADELAKLGANGDENNEIYSLPHPQSYSRQLIRDSIRRAWKKEWQESKEYKHTKNFYSGPDTNRAKLLLKHSKTSVTKLIQMITGHNFLSYFQNKVDNTIYPYCRLCDEEYETFHHFVTSCPVLRQRRIDIFGDDQYSEEDWKPQQFLDFYLHKEIEAWMNSMDYLVEQPLYYLDHDYSSDGDIG